MGHDNHDDHGHHHVDDLSGFSLFRLIWPAALLLLVVFITKTSCRGSGCCGDGESCSKPGTHHEMQHEGGHQGEGHGEHMEGEHH